MKPWLLVLLVVLAPAWAAWAQEASLPDDAAVADALRTLGAEGDEDDPLGAGDVASLRDVPMPTRRSELPEVLRVPAEAGDALVAIPGVRETSHRVDVRFAEGIALVRTELALSSRASHVAEARYRLPWPRDAWLVALEACEGAECRSATPDGSTRYDAAVIAEAFGVSRVASEVTAESPARAADPSARATTNASTATTSTATTSTATTSTATTSATPTSASTATTPSIPSASIPSATLFAADTHADARGPALSVHVAPIAPGATVTLRVAYAVPLGVTGGIARLTIPARGNDLRSVPARLTFDAGDLLAPTLQRGPATAAVEVDPWTPIELSARLPSGALHGSAHTFPCGARRCAHVRLAAGPRTGPPEHVGLLVDVSPSTFGPTRGRLSPTLASLLATLPPGSDVRALAFAARAETLVDTALAPADVPFGALAGASALELGGSTRLDAALRALPSGIDHAVLVGDGGFTEGPHTDAALEDAARRGLRLSALVLDERAPHPRLREAVERLGGRLVRLSPELFAPRREAALEEALAALFAPRLGTARVGATPMGELRAGESLAWTGELRRGELTLGRLGWRPRRSRDPELSAALDALGRRIAGEPTRLAHAGAASSGSCEELARATPHAASPRSPWMVADVRSCALPTPPPPEPSTLGRGIPAETVLSMLRRRVVPAARGCFRRDRAGREDYATRAVFELHLADREVTSADVRGEIDDELRECLLQSVDGLDVPAYAGTIVVRYPLYTRASGPALTIELRPDVADVVDRTLPPPP